MSITLFQAVQLNLRQFNIITMLGRYYQRQASSLELGHPTVNKFEAQDKTIDANIPRNILGIDWNAVTDQLSLISKETDLMSELTTKREVLQESSRIFDPLGFATPITIRSKLLIQTL